MFILCHSARWIPNIWEMIDLANESAEEWPLWIGKIEQKGMTFDHDFGYSLPKKRGKKKRRMASLDR